MQVFILLQVGRNMRFVLALDNKPNKIQALGHSALGIRCKIGENIGVISRPCKEKLAVSCACLAHSFCFVNIPLNHTPDAFIQMIQLSKCRVFFLSASLLGSLKEKLKQSPMLRVVFVFDDQKYEQIH
ncbi:MAG: hypothetical protein EZS28_005667 [Streblomastix strix]|uniref:AMP-dependent synthetase/ligase domain-containing protein n=1 Tax=Streblomastix strix TaxID=222440 RepID=A0A5J4WWF5_9EUKA|nr:MAG: hypothetical protein EZS28_005667 [Streblomastix strix]